MQKIRLVSISEIKPSPENDVIYRPIDFASPELHALAASVGKNGILEPLVISADGFILSGHRRFAAAKLAGIQEIPCRVDPICHGDQGFIETLREYNRNRVKTFDEAAREEIVSMNPELAYQTVLSERAEAAKITVQPIEILGIKKRAKISAAKIPFLQAAQSVVEGLREYWPVTARRVFYGLLNVGPLRHAGKPGSVFKNDRASYQDLANLLTRARLTGDIPMEAIADETRPISLWDAFDSATDFMRGQIDRFLSGFSRNLLQSQPNHIEILGEKNTLGPVLEPIASEYRLPLTIGRGFCSLPPRVEMVRRFRRSGKENLVVIVVSDHDPDGEEICNSFGRSLRDDLGVASVKLIRAGLTREQVNRFGIRFGQPLKEKSSNAKKFRALYGDTCFEVEALSPDVLAGEVRQAVLSVLDLGAFNREVEAEKGDSWHLMTFRNVAKPSLLRLLGEI